MRGAGLLVGAMQIFPDTVQTFPIEIIRLFVLRKM